MTYYFYRSASPFSQFYPASFTAPLPTFDHPNDPSLPTEHTFFCAEQWLMLSKALLFQDTATAQLVLEATKPQQCKALGRKVGNFDEETWKQHRESIVEQGSYWKFSRAEGLKEELLATGDKESVEASPTDRIWGIGFAEAKADQNRDRWGLNLLGVALMKVREKLREEQQQKIERSLM